MVLGRKNMTKHKSKHARRRIKNSILQTNTPIPIRKPERPIRKECAENKQDNLLFKILNDNSDLETKIDTCGDAIINLWLIHPEMHTYIKETLNCVIQNTIKK
jgi:hypothetical protein